MSRNPAYQGGVFAFTGQKTAAKDVGKKRAQNEASPPVAPSRHVMAWLTWDFSSGRLSVTTAGSGNIAAATLPRCGPGSSGITPSPLEAHSRNPSGLTHISGVHARALCSHPFQNTLTLVLLA